MPSMTVSPIWATMPPSTVGSTMTFTVDLLAGGVGRARRRAVLLVLGERHGRADLGHLCSFALGGASDDELVDDRRQVADPAGSRRASRSTPAVVRAPCRRAGPRRSAWRRSAGMCASVSALRSSSLPSTIAGEAEQLVFDLVEVALGTSDLEQASGVGVDPLVSSFELTPVGGADPGDVVLDQPLVGGRRRGEPVTTCSTRADRQPGDLGAQLGAGPAASGDRRRRPPSLEVGDLGLDAGAIGRRRARSAAWASATASTGPARRRCRPLAWRICAGLGGRPRR